MMSPKLEAMLDQAKLIYRSMSIRQQEEWNRRAARAWVIGELKARHGLDEQQATKIADHAADDVYGFSL
jgi:hypothetical protein